MEYHIWELVDLSKIEICVDIETKFKEKIERKIRKGKIPLIAREIKVNPTRIYEYFIWKSSLMPLTKLIKLCEKFRISKEELEKSVTEYRQKGSTVGVKNPKLPLKITPLTTFLTSHLFFDGSLPDDKRNTYYNNKEKDIMNDFLEACKEIFGEIHYICKRDHRRVLKCSMPRIIGEVLKHVYQVSSFHGSKGRISKFIKRLPHDHKLAFIIAAIIDEGSIAFDSSSIFGVENKELAQGVLKICEEVGLETKGLKKKKEREFYYFYLKEPEVLYQKAEEVRKNYPEISLRFKMKRLQRALEIKAQSFGYTKKFAEGRKKRVIERLKENPQSVNDLAKELLIPPRTVRRYLYKMIEAKKIERKVVGKEYIYNMTRQAESSPIS